MPYLAFQCFSCQHMQVKEVRKSSSSSSKWTCAICNEKQSVRKVFSRADTAKEVRKFVQNFNLTAGQAAQAEVISRLDYSSPEDEERQMTGTLGNSDYAGQRKTFKWDKYLPDEEQVCSGDGDEFQQSDDLRFTTTLPYPTSRRRTRPRSSSPPKRPMRGFTTSRDDAEPGSSPSDSRKRPMCTSRLDNSLKFQKGNDSGSEGSTPLGQSSWSLSTSRQSTSSYLPTLDSDGPPKNITSCHAQGSGANTSKWSKYLN